MVPICGRSFSQNNYGARLFCQMLGKADGAVEMSEEVLSEDAYIVGRCTQNDKSLTSCTGACNKRKVGGNCQTWAANCRKGSKSVPWITCYGKIFFLTHLTFS